MGGDDMERVGKDDFTPGFVPNHNHGSVDYTSVGSGHVHQMFICYVSCYPNSGWESCALHGRICWF